MKRNEMNGRATKRQGQKMSGGWLLAVVCLLFASSCRAPAPQAGRYQWTITALDGNMPDSVRRIDTDTGEVARWDRATTKWVLETLPLDRDDIRKQRTGLEARRAEQEKQRTGLETQRAERKRERQEKQAQQEAFLKLLSEMPLEKQVVWARNIGIYKFRGMSHDEPAFEHLESLKGERDSGACPYKATDDGLVVWFSGMADGGSLEFGLSRTLIDSNQVFPAPPTIIDDVKAEIKRQAEKQKEAQAKKP